MIDTCLSHLYILYWISISVLWCFIAYFVYLAIKVRRIIKITEQQAKDLEGKAAHLVFLAKMVSEAHRIEEEDDNGKT